MGTDGSNSKTSEMKTLALCLPCLVNQAVRLLRLAKADEESAERILRETLADLAQADFNEPAPVHSSRAFARVVAATGVADPFAEAKTRSTEAALALYPELSQWVCDAADPFVAAVRLAVAGNVIDLAIAESVTPAEIRAAAEAALGVELHADSLADLARRVREARSILYLADNAGELVFDRLLLERINPERVTLVVRGAPILNDATRADATASNLPAGLTIIDNGTALPGTWLPSVSDEFRAAWENADLVISKGQGNYETLVGRTDRPTFFLFKVKCAAVSARTDLPVGTLVASQTR